MKKFIIWVVMQFLYRGLKVLYMKDKRVQNELDGWNQDMVIQLKVMHGPCMTMKYSYLQGIKKSHESADIIITFKSVDCALLVFTGFMSVQQAYLEHRFILKGNIHESMRLVRCIDLVEIYLFPRFMTKRILNHQEDKYYSSLYIYLKALLTF